MIFFYIKWPFSFFGLTDLIFDNICTVFLYASYAFFLKIKLNISTYSTYIIISSF